MKKDMNIIIRTKVFDYLKKEFGADFDNDWIKGYGSKHNLKKNTIDFCDDLCCEILSKSEKVFTSKKLMNEIYDKIERVPKNSRIEMVWYKDKVKAVFSELVNNSINFEIKKASDNLCSVLIIKT